MNIFENGTKDGVFFTRTALNLGITYNSGLEWAAFENEKIVSHSKTIF